MPDAMAMATSTKLGISSVPFLYSYKAIYCVACRYYGVFSVIKGTVGDLPSMNPPHANYGASQPREWTPKMVVQGSDQAAEIGRGSTANQ